MIDHQQDYCANHCDQKTVKIQARHARRAEGVEKPSSDHRTNNSQYDIEEDAFSVLFTILLPMKPATKPNTIQARNNILHPPQDIDFSNPSARSQLDRMTSKR
jgi:hypothetical protein